MKESLSLNTDAPKIPSSSRYKFKLPPSDEVKNTPEFKAISSSTSSEVEKSSLF